MINFGLGDIMARLAKTLEQVAEEAMALPESRAQLADLLVESLDGEEFGRIEQLWPAEAKRRRDEVRSGTVTKRYPLRSFPPRWQRRDLREGGVGQTNEARDVLCSLPG